MEEGFPPGHRDLIVSSREFIKLLENTREQLIGYNGTDHCATHEYNQEVVLKHVRLKD